MSNIIIISREGDQSTCDVIEWIHHFNNTVYRINDEPSIIIKAIEISKNSQFIFEANNADINLNEVKSFWHRRGNIKIDLPSIDISEDFPFKREILFHLKNEKRKIADFFNYTFKKKKHLGNAFQADLNKLITLQKALDLKISIPPTLITTKKSELVIFKTKYKNIICKPISEGVMLSRVNMGSVMTYTNVVTDEQLLKFPEKFPVSLFQQKIEKKYEIRTFFLDGKFFSMAIFSQTDTQTAVDFRRYNTKKPNRKVPYDLPREIKDKLLLLMQDLELNTGSIDLAVDLNNEYIFFEVNPVGQFGMTSSPCNFFLEKKIAEYLIKSNET